MFSIRSKYPFALTLLVVSACKAIAGGISGTWSGTSICTVKDSPCHDENVIYHITEPDSAGKLTIRADKLVNGQPEDMGTIDCTFDSKASTLTCPMQNGIWKFTVTNNKMKGTLTLSDGRLYRNIDVTKDK